MKRCMIVSLGLIVAAGLLINEGLAWRGGGGGGRGGGGGGGGGRGGGGFQGGAPAGGHSGGGRPAPAARPAGGGAAGGASAAGRGTAGANRGPGFSSPGGAKPAGGAKAAGGAKVAGGAASGRGAVQPGTRPGVAAGAGAPRVGAGAVARPAVAAGGARAGAATGARAGALPGLGSGSVAQSREARAAGLQDRMTMGERQGQRQGARGERQQSRQDYRGGAREDWQNWAGEHGDWYHGAWSGGWYPGATFANYPVASALGVTWWGVNRMSNAFGMGGYENPYYGDSGGGGYDYSQPIAAYDSTAEQPAATDATAAAAAPPDANQEGMAQFDQAREAFARGDYKQALELCNQTLKSMPNDSVVHEFRSLTQFALQNYREAAAGAYAVLSVGPGWDWTTLSSLYGNVADYTTQLRALEAFVKKNPKSSDGHFLLAYHYLTAGNPDAAQEELRVVDKLTPKDRLVTQLLSLSSKPGEEPAETPSAQPIPDDKLIKAEQLVGTWTAGGSGGSRFEMVLDKDSSFSWKFTSGKKSDQIKGVFAVEQNNLALEVDDGSVMLAEITLTDSKLRFKVIGSDPADPGLTFSRAK